MKRLWNAFGAFFSALKQKPVKEQSLIEAKPQENSASSKGFDFMVLLQEKGRLIDFLKEDIDQYTDEQVGGAVRKIHRDCSQVLSTYASVSPVLSNEEGSLIKLDKDFSRSEISLEGNVIGSGPYSGEVTHAGWKVTSINIPSHYNMSDNPVITKARVYVDT